MSQLSILSGIIAGEGQGGNQADQFGVAATIQNRLDRRVSRRIWRRIWDCDSPRSVLGFPNRLGTPTPYTDALAGALLNGDLSDLATGNATYCRMQRVTLIPIWGRILLDREVTLIPINSTGRVDSQLELRQHLIFNFRNGMFGDSANFEFQRRREPK